MDELVQDALNRYIQDDVHFVEAVKKGLASLDHGEYVIHEDVGNPIDRLFQA